MTHKFKDEIIDWLNGGQYEFRTSYSEDWFPLQVLNAFDRATGVRKVDEYKHLREAEAQGKTIQFSHGIRLREKWIDLKDVSRFTLPANRYRIKPKTKKMVQWLIRNEFGDYLPTLTFYEIGVIPNISYAEAIKPLPHTEIEVDCE